MDREQDNWRCRTYLVTNLAYISFVRLLPLRAVRNEVLRERSSDTSLCGRSKRPILPPLTRKSCTCTQQAASLAGRLEARQHPTHLSIHGMYPPVLLRFPGCSTPDSNRRFGGRCKNGFSVALAGLGGGSLVADSAAIENA